MEIFQATQSSVYKLLIVCSNSFFLKTMNPCKFEIQSNFQSDHLFYDCKLKCFSLYKSFLVVLVCSFFLLSSYFVTFINYSFKLYYFSSRNKTRQAHCPLWNENSHAHLCHELTQDVGLLRHRRSVYFFHCFSGRVPARHMLLLQVYTAYRICLPRHCVRWEAMFVKIMKSMNDYYNHTIICLLA